MRHIVTVLDVLNLFPHRKKSFAYKVLQGIRDATGKKVVTVAELAEYAGFTEQELRHALGLAAN